MRNGNFAHENVGVGVHMMDCGHDVRISRAHFEPHSSQVNICSSSTQSFGSAQTSSLGRSRICLVITVIDFPNMVSEAVRTILHKKPPN